MWSCGAVNQYEVGSVYELAVGFGLVCCSLSGTPKNVLSDWETEEATALPGIAGKGALDPEAIA